jgi:preprotein translocase subunit SecA
MDTVSLYVDKVASDEVAPSEWDLRELNDTLRPFVPLEPISLTDEEKENGKVEDFKQRLLDETQKLYEAKEKEITEAGGDMREIERVALLKVVDMKWMDNIDDMAQLRQGIGLQSLGQRDPVVEYRLQGFDMFEEMITSIREEVVKMLMHVRIEQKVEREQVAEVTGTNKDDSAAPVQRKVEQKVGRNDPCPCGSGKKYKLCCGRNG